jgi:hypothetical protein
LLRLIVIFAKLLRVVESPLQWYTLYVDSFFSKQESKQSRHVFAVMKKYR